MPGPLCLVWMDASIPETLHRDAILPAIEEAELEPYRAAAAELALEPLLLAERVVVACSLVPEALAYAMGVRGARGRRTVLLLPESTGGAFAATSVGYVLEADGSVSGVERVRGRLVERLRAPAAPDQAVELLDSLERPVIPGVDHGVTDRFRGRISYSPEWKRRLADLRRGGDREALKRAERELDPARDEAALWIDLLLSYRAVSAWKEMAALVPRMPPPLARTSLVQEQLAFALNRNGDWEEAVSVLERVIAKRGASSETNALLGRVYKDRWEAAAKTGDRALAARWLDQAIAAYLGGFEADWRDTYPGINAATLMELREPPDPRLGRILPVVLYAAERSLSGNEADYWSHATVLEASVLSRDRERASRALEDALAAVRERWEPETTARNLRLIREARERRGEDPSWVGAIEDELGTSNPFSAP